MLGAAVEVVDEVKDIVEVVDDVVEDVDEDEDGDLASVVDVKSKAGAASEVASAPSRRTRSSPPVVATTNP